MRLAYRFVFLLICAFALSASGCSSGSDLAGCELACGAHGVCDGWAEPPACKCFPGWAGPACDRCAEGYEDDGAGGCEEMVVPATCEVDSCSGHGQCDDASGAVICLCELGYTGPRCASCQAGYHPDGVGGCAPNVSCAEVDPCGAHGTCSEEGGAAHCVCDAGWGGAYCAACAAGYHLDGADCVADEQCGTPDPCGDHGSCDDGGGVIVCTCDSGYAGDRCAVCAAGWVDLGNGCEQIATCDQYPFGDAAYIYEMRIATGEDDCCFDFTGDGQIDNMYGAVVDLMSSIPDAPDLNQILNDAIVDGSLCQIYDFQGLDGAVDDPALGLNLMWGTDPDGLYDDNLDGDEIFTVDAASFVPDGAACTAAPVNPFDSAAVSGGMLLAQAEALDGLVFPSLMAGEALTTMRLYQVHLQADLSLGPNGPLLAQGQLAGVVAVDDLCQEINTWVEQECACLELTEPLLTCGINLEGDFEVTCAEGTGGTCDDQIPAEQRCAQMMSMCPVMTLVLAADVDTNSDGIADAMSVGILFSATSATVSGITP